MSNASLKEQLQAVASQLSDPVSKEQKEQKKFYASTPKTTPKIKKPKPRWLEYVQYGVELLRVYFPEGFKSGLDVKPLKKGIKEDLVRRLSGIDSIVTEDKACMVKSLSYYVNTAAYHKNVLEGTMRIDLDGKPAGVVSAEEAKYSVEKHQAKLLKKSVSVNQPDQESKLIL